MIITKLSPNEIFVFGSNESGIHSAGAAKTAVDSFGAKIGQGFGLQGQSFAIPTKDWMIKTLNLDDIKFYVKRFIQFTMMDTYMDVQNKYLVTEIGCGLDGYTPEDIAPMFKMVPYLKNKNIILPDSFIKALENRFDTR